MASTSIASAVRIGQAEGGGMWIAPGGIVNAARSVSPGPRASGCFVSHSASRRLTVGTVAKL